MNHTSTAPETAPAALAEATGDAALSPSHYRSHPSGIEPLRITRLLMFDLGNAVKYVMRHPFKGNPLRDLRKARVYLDDAKANAPETLYVPNPAAHLLHLVAAAEPNPVCAAFYRAVAGSNFDAAFAELNVLISAAEANE